MTRFGYTLMTEQSGPKELVRYAVSAEQVGFDFEVSSDHFSPWLTSQGHAPNAWTMRPSTTIRLAPTGAGSTGLLWSSVSPSNSTSRMRAPRRSSLSVETTICLMSSVA